MSQQVGYAELEDLPARMPTRSSHSDMQLLRQRLAAAAAGAGGQGRAAAAAARAADPLADLLS